MVALKNGIIQNKDGHRFDRSTGTWKNQNDETQQTDTENKQPDAKEKQPDAEQKPSDTKDKPSDTKTKETPAETPKPNVETPKTPGETAKTLTKTPKPGIISYNIDGKQVYILVDNVSHFNELRRQLANGITLNDDLIKKMKPILAEVHLPDGTKIFNDKTKLSQLDDIMKHHRGKEISSFDDFLKYVLRKIR